MTNQIKSLSSVIFLVLSITAVDIAVFPVRAEAYPRNDIFSGVRNSTRARAMSFSYLSLADDATALFYNAAGLSTIDERSVYLDFGEGGDVSRDIRGAFVLPFENMALGAGVYRRDFDTSGNEKVFILGAAYRLAQGAEGSFLSFGISLRMNSLSSDDSGGCDICPFDDMDTGISGDAGVMIRPLPMVSIAYVMENVHEREYDNGTEKTKYERESRWGISLLWKDFLVMSWEKEISSGSDHDHFGLLFDSSVPLEMIAGFHKEKVTGGLRWTGSRFNLGLSFSPLDDSRLYTSVAIEYFIDKRNREN
ncbi:MAG: hypothetical protein JW814_05880 [Candidatus Krumholzibacteriota bacterium]|nr:hypothetical protein [Candidatus Krumholzibacteriota bacterium]